MRTIGNLDPKQRTLFYKELIKRDNNTLTYLVKEQRDFDNNELNNALLELEGTSPRTNLKRPLLRELEIQTDHRNFDPSKEADEWVPTLQLFAAIDPYLNGKSERKTIELRRNAANMLRKDPNGKMVEYISKYKDHKTKEHYLNKVQDLFIDYRGFSI